MASEFLKNLTIKYKRFRRWTESDDFTKLIAKIMAWFIIGIFVLSAFVVMIQ